MKQTAVVILNWNGRELLERFLPSLISHTPRIGVEVDIIVADNGSTDDSLSFLKQHYPEVKIIPLGKNYGFAEGYNRALQGLEYQYAVLLNSDVEVTHAWLSSAIDYLEANENTAALQPKILSYKDKSHFEYAGAAGGFIDQYGYPFCRGRLFGSVEAEEGQYDEIMPVFWTSGACMFVRLQDFRDAGGFDKRFFAHQEEIDLCWRLKARGRELVCFPQSVVYHVGGATLNAEDPMKTYLNFRNNLLMIYKNIPADRYKKVMRARFILDYLSALRFVMQAKPKNARAIYKARHDFCQLREEYQPTRADNLNRTIIQYPAGFIRKNLIYEYYIGKKKRFSQL